MLNTADSADPSSKARGTDRLALLIALILLIGMAIAVTAIQWRMTPTFDEQNHVARGIAILHTGDYRLCYHHPPLANIVQGMPVAWLPNGFSTSMPAWTNLGIWSAAKQVIWSDPTQGVRLIRLARLPMLLFVVGLGLLIFCWARALFGPWGGVTALALYALDPNMLAHGGLATTDIAAACTMLLALYLLRGYLLKPTWGRMALAGVGLGLALATKFTALLLLPVVGLTLLVVALWPGAVPIGWPAAKGLRFIRLLGVYLGLLLMSGVTVWAVYGFKVEPLGAKPGQPLPANASALERVPVPALQYLRGLKTVMTEAEGHRSYLLGQTDTTGKGWWYYFPVAMAVKTPGPELLAMLGILLLALVPAVRARWAVAGHEWLLLLLTPALLFLAALGVLGISLNLGIRHLLPFYPFIIVAAGGWAALPNMAARRWVPGVLVATQVLALVCGLWPHGDALAYFNIVGRRLNYERPVLVDSNVDWGQDLGRLAEYQRREHTGPIYLSYFGTTPPEAYGLDYQPVAGFGLMRQAPRPDWSTMHGLLAISVTNLFGGAGYTGVDYRVKLPGKPVAKVGETIYLFQVTPAAGHL